MILQISQELEHEHRVEVKRLDIEKIKRETSALSHYASQVLLCFPNVSRTLCVLPEEEEDGCPPTTAPAAPRLRLPPSQRPALSPAATRSGATSLSVTGRKIFEKKKISTW